MDVEIVSVPRDLNSNGSRALRLALTNAVAAAVNKAIEALRVRHELDCARDHARSLAVRASALKR